MRMSGVDLSEHKRISSGSLCTERGSVIDTSENLRKGSAAVDKGGVPLGLRRERGPLGLPSRVSREELERFDRTLWQRNPHVRNVMLDEARDTARRIGTVSYMAGGTAAWFAMHNLLLSGDAASLTVAVCSVVVLRAALKGPIERAVRDSSLKSMIRRYCR